MRGNHWHLRCAAIAGLVGLAAVLSAGTAPVSWQVEGVREAYPCEGEPGFLRLDFWVGAWDVYVQERKVGTNRIEKILHGCAILEHWASTGGGEGKSLFYYNHVTGKWKQVWVTQTATRPGGLKEKELVEEFEDGGVRFQGEIPLQDGGTMLDRTTLTPLGNGRVRQVIETSRDGGKTWRAGFDAIYVRR